MPYPAKLPDVKVLVAMRKPHAKNRDHVGNCKEGHTLTDIADTFGAKRPSVYTKLRDAGEETSAVRRYSDTLPWTVSPEHSDHWDVHMLRELSKRNQGLPPGYRGHGRALDMWLEELDKAGKVVDYNARQGFIRRKRREGEEGYIRQPKAQRKGVGVTLPVRTRRAPG